MVGEGDPLALVESVQHVGAGEQMDHVSHRLVTSLAARHGAGARPGSWWTSDDARSGHRARPRIVAVEH